MCVSFLVWSICREQYVCLCVCVIEMCVGDRSMVVFCACGCVRVQEPAAPCCVFINSTLEDIHGCSHLNGHLRGPL